MNDIDLTIGLIEQLAMLWESPATSAEAHGFSALRRQCARRPTCPDHHRRAQLTRSLAKNRSKVSEDVWSSYINEGRLLSGEAAVAEGIS